MIFMSNRPIIGVFAANPYTVTSMTMELEGFVNADFVEAYKLDDAKKICKEKNPTILIIDSSIAGVEELNLAKEFFGYKVILITPLKDFASMKMDMDNIVEVLEKPVNFITLRNLLKRFLEGKK